MAINPAFAVIAVFHVVRRAFNFGFTKPTTDMLYAVVSPEAKYKAKNFIDTAAYRGWDFISIWIVRAAGGLGISGVALACLPIAALWMLIARRIGSEYRARDELQTESTS